MPPLPADIPPCFDRLVPAPAEKAMTRAETLRLIAALRISEVEKSACGKRAVDFMQSLRSEAG